MQSLNPDLSEQSTSSTNAPIILSSHNTGTQAVTRKMFFLSVWVSFAAWIAEFDIGYAGIVLIMPSYQKAFGHCRSVHDPDTGNAIEACELSTLQQSLISLTLLFMAVGSVLAGLVGSKLGRRRTIQMACIFCLVGAAGMLGTTGSFVSYMVCKCINGVGIGQLLASAIVYGAECVAADKRGLLLGIFNIGLAMGNVTAAAVCAGSATLAPDNDWQWKTPIICQIPLSVILAVGMYLFPESPRWLLLKKKEEEARTSFATLLGLNALSTEVAVQVEDIQRHLEFERSLSKTTSWIEIYHGANLRRTAVSGLILVALAITGIQFVAPFAALFLSGVGVENPYVVNVIVGLCIFGGACIGSIPLEYGGRRFSMLVGYSLMAICMLIFSSVATGLGADNPIAKHVVVAFVCIWAFVFGGFIGPSVWLASAEMHCLQLRTYGQANTTFCYEIFAFGATFWTPYMLNPEYGNMGTNVGYFYFGITVAVLVLVFLFVPETSRLTLEQIDDYFASGKPAWKTSTSENLKISREVALNTTSSPRGQSEVEKQVPCTRTHNSEIEVR
ncbi:mfs monosaccharide transporter protein [Penicillium macrosclerotiorum]|uniref:mfs monosaccharide transporter protein n=1 Tax=Penicillium macrosclerotiorum TaxID=303699 RepID=UPI002547D698|nr:mfs monosaccharide transporter protein [Penicillium macrosclerotiorum]KAJ5689450.1 mfs monosaccharide transporter protein [Penicillium macrosclerotiorum]